MVMGVQDKKMPSLMRWASDRERECEREWEQGCQGFMLI